MWRTTAVLFVFLVTCVGFLFVACMPAVVLPELIPVSCGHGRLMVYDSTNKEWVCYEGLSLSESGDLVLNSASGADIVFGVAGATKFRLTSNTSFFSTQPLVIQNVAQGSNPGAVSNGQIRLWESSGGPTGHIVGRINGTNYVWNADAGLVFWNRPVMEANAKAYFAAENARFEFENPGFRGLGIEAPYPEAADFRLADGHIDETVSYRSGVRFEVGDASVLVADWVDDDKVHMLPSSLADEILHLVNNDSEFRAALIAALEGG